MNFEMFFDNNNNKELFMETSLRRLTRAEKRALKRQSRQDKNVNSIEKGYTKPFRLKKIIPKTANQGRVFSEFEDGQNILMHGLPGSGKCQGEDVEVNLMVPDHIYEILKKMS